MLEEPYFIRRRSREDGLIESVCRFCGHVCATRRLEVLKIVERTHQCPELRTVRQKAEKQPDRLSD